MGRALINRGRRLTSAMPLIAVAGLERTNASSSVGSLSECCCGTRNAAVDDRDEAALCLACVLRTIEDFLSFAKGYVPNRYDQSGGKMSIRIVYGLIAGLGQHDCQRASKTVSHFPRPRLERVTLHRCPDEPPRVLRQQNKFMILPNEVVCQ